MWDTSLEKTLPREEEHNANKPQKEWGSINCCFGKEWGRERNRMKHVLTADWPEWGGVSFPIRQLVVIRDRPRTKLIAFVRNLTANGHCLKEGKLSGRPLKRNESPSLDKQGNWIFPCPLFMSFRFMYASCGHYDDLHYVTRKLSIHQIKLHNTWTTLKAFSTFPLNYCSCVRFA